MPQKQLQTTNFQLDPGTHKKLRIAAIQAGISMGEAIRQAISLWLVKQKRKGGASHGKGSL